MVQVKSETKYIFVDLDGTLIKTDLLFESFLKLVKNNPKKTIISIWILLTKGIAKFKNYIAINTEINPEILPTNSHLLDYLLHEKISNRKIILATASNEKFAKQVAEHYAIFDDVIASTEEVNLKGKNKLEKIKEVAKGEDFEYIGDSSADIPIWQESKEITIVSDNKKLINKVCKIKHPKYLFSEETNSLKTFLKAIRVHQWAKNILLFVPIVMAQQVLNLSLWIDLLLAFLSFSLCASSVYVFNDLLDLDADRLHETKKKRPIASGSLPIPIASFIIPIFLFLGILISCLLPQAFFITLLSYLFLTTAYTFYLKQLIIIDIVVLSALYSIRIFAGGTACSILVSPWLIAFSVFFFLSLACVKRYIELLKTAANNTELVAGRGYVSKDLSIVSQSGIASGFISVLVLALYINGHEVKSFYRNEELLWLFCPLLLYWIFRIWILANRDQVHEDPVVYALKDKTSYVLGVIGLIIIVLATL